MALVMLPCEMPWWSMVHRKLADIQKCSTVDHLVEHMQKIHDTCNVSLDPDEDKRDCTIFFGLRTYMNSLIAPSEREHLLLHTIPNIARRAQELRNHRPARGMSFSLQQHTEGAELQYPFVAALLANAFFSTFPKRTEKTHPTLQDFNFTHFFVDLATSNSQRAKFQALMYYFDWIEKSDENIRGSLKVARRVMTGRQWLTIEDWMECGVPLSGIEIKHEARIERSPPDVIQTVFATSRIGGNVLRSGNSQENIQLCTVPEALVTLLYVEALEDNETLYVEGGRQVARIMDARGRGIVELLETPRAVSLNLMDAEVYDRSIEESQFEEDNILRELNKCLLAFRQHLTCAVFEPSRERRDARRLSPIGESGTNSPGDAPTMATIVIKQASSTKSSESSVRQQDLHFLSPSPSGLVVGPTASGRRGRFIVLGSSGECLPVTRRSLSQCTGSSLYSSCESSDDEFHSARDSVEDSEDEDDEEFARKYSHELDTPEKRFSFAQRLREALQQSESYTESTDDSYACGISVADSKNCDNAIRVRRAGSDGFVLQADSLDDTFYDDCLKYGEKMIGTDGQKKNQNGPAKSRERKNSSKYSFSTELGSEQEEVYEQFSKYGLWMEDPIGHKERELDPRDVAVLRFAGSLLKRTLSESFVGVPLTEGCINSVGNPAEETSIQSYQQKQEKPILNSRSLSMELAKHKHRLAAQLVKKSLLGIGLLCRGQSKKHRKWSISLVHTLQTINCGDIVVKPPVEIAQILQRRKVNSNLRPIATGNWGCGRRHQGDVQLKFVIQWLAASVAGLPVLIYHTASNERLAKLDTVCRILLDRRWSVGRLARLMLRHAKRMLEENEEEDSQEFLEKLIGFPPPQSN